MDRDPYELERRIVEAVPNPLQVVREAEIGPLVGRAPSWFKHMRQKLEAEGFPRQCVYGRWYARDVVRFLLMRQHGVTPKSAHEIEIETELADVIARTDRYLNRRYRRRSHV